MLFFSEYRIIRLENKEVIYHSEILEDVDNNLMEFLAIMATARYINAKKIKSAVIFTDSAVALKWLGEKKIKVSLPMGKELKSEVEKAIKLLGAKSFICPVLKWQTNVWGENPADFGRKSN